MGKKKGEKLDTLEEIKRLLVLGLNHQGVTGKRIAAVLEIDPAIISRLLTKGTKKD